MKNIITQVCIKKEELELIKDDFLTAEDIYTAPLNVKHPLNRHYSFRKKRIFAYILI